MRRETLRTVEILVESGIALHGAKVRRSTHSFLKMREHYKTEQTEARMPIPRSPRGFTIRLFSTTWKGNSRCQYRGQRSSEQAPAERAAWWYLYRDAPRTRDDGPIAEDVRRTDIGN